MIRLIIRCKYSFFKCQNMTLCKNNSTFNIVQVNNYWSVKTKKIQTQRKKNEILFLR